MDPEKLKSIMAGKDYELNIVTSTDGSTINGLIVAWITQVSIEPPLMAVCLGLKKYTRELVDRSGVMAINILAQDQADMVAAFGYRSGREIDKFEGVRYRPGVTGSPILENASAYLDCRVTESLEAGDHRLYVAEVIDCDLLSEKPRLAYQWFLSQTKAA
jgi:flavin reductase (DIM6/NTAB) family NADH-FMN oxidoreductase RutF